LGRGKLRVYYLTVAEYATRGGGVFVHCSFNSDNSLRSLLVCDTLNDKGKHIIKAYTIEKGLNSLLFCVFCALWVFIV
jgi:predicted GNAT superfamily acetyltransferase